MRIDVHTLSDCSLMRDTVQQRICLTDNVHLNLHKIVCVQPHLVCILRTSVKLFFFFFALCLAETLEIKEKARPLHKAQPVIRTKIIYDTAKKVTPMQNLSGF